jgi:5-methylcytosine-specific restriction endonuclease McrA
MSGIDTNVTRYKYSDTYMGLTDIRLTWMKTQDERRIYFRSKLWERDQGRCGICGGYVAYQDMDVDHSRARAMGGADHWDNLRPSHAECNRRRRHLDIHPGRLRRAPQ